MSSGCLSILVPSGYWKEKPASSVQVNKTTGVGVGEMEGVSTFLPTSGFCFEIIKADVPPSNIKEAMISKTFLENILSVIIDLMKKFKYLLFLGLGIFLMLSVTSPVEAAKKRVWGKTIVTPAAKSGAVSISAKLTGWKQYLNVSFKGVAGTKGIAYELIYSSNGVDQGAGGGVSPSDGNVSRSLFLGTCSHGACVAHKNISNVRLRISYATTAGQNITKNYRVKY